MERFRSLAALPPLVFCLLVAPAATVAAQSVLEQVPRDALGFAVVRNLTETDAKVGKALSAIGSRLPGALALVKSIAGLDAGLDLDRDLLIVLLPPQNNAEQFHLALWLPVNDYDALVRSLDGDPERRVATVTLAGEDLLAVRKSDWAVVMDVDQRDRLGQLDESQPTPPQQIELWSKWIATNDATVVVLQGGMRAAWAFAAKEGLFDATKGTPSAVDKGNELFGPPPDSEVDDLFGPAGSRTAGSGSWRAIRQTFQTIFTDAPELARWMAEAEGAACGLRLDDNGNAVAGLRLAFSHDFSPMSLRNDEPVATGAAPALYTGGPFVVASSGQVSPRWAVPAVAPYARQVSNDW